jgi:hypothetical protein
MLQFVVTFIGQQDVKFCHWLSQLKKKVIGNECTDIKDIFIGG